MADLVELFCGGMQVKSLNKTIDALTETVVSAKKNIAKTKSTTDSAGALLEDWIKILNQTSFARNALQDSRWKGPIEDNEDEGDEVLVQVDQLTSELEALEEQNRKLQAQLDSYKRPDSLERSRKRQKT